MRGGGPRYTSLSSFDAPCSLTYFTYSYYYSSHAARHYRHSLSNSYLLHLYSSCSLGSAYFSLLRPHTRLAAHCGPTNARLRAHLGIVVPPGDCEILVGGEARRWEEGKVSA